jgi:hypothetical protein
MHFQQNKARHRPQDHRFTAIDYSDPNERFCICGARKSTGKPDAKRRYHNNPTEYKGVYYASQLEANYGAELDRRLNAKQIKGWKRQVPVDLRVNGILICTYRVDFEVEYPDGLIEWVETKGRETADWRVKARLLEAIYDEEIRAGTRRYVVVKQ